MVLCPVGMLNKVSPDIIAGLSDRVSYYSIRSSTIASINSCTLRGSVCQCCSNFAKAGTSGTSFIPLLVVESPKCTNGNGQTLSPCWVVEVRLSLRFKGYGEDSSSPTFYLCPLCKGQQSSKKTANQVCFYWRTVQLAGHSPHFIPLLVDTEHAFWKSSSVSHH